MLAHVEGYVVWKKLPREWLDKHLPNYTHRAMNELMADHVRRGGEIHQVKETRAEHIEWRFHYDLRIPIINRRVYIETVFVHERDPEDCTIYVVNMHDA